MAAVPFAGAGCLADPGRRVVRLANWGGAGDDSEFNRLAKALQAEFEAANPGLDLRVEGIPGSQDYVRKLLLSHISGAMPDVVTLDASSAAAFIDYGTLRDLREFADRDPEFDWNDFFPNVVDIARRGQAVYAVPVDFTPMVMYVNRRHFREAGLAVPEPGWSWDDFLEAALRLTREGRYGFDSPNWMPGWVTWLWNNGADVLDPLGRRATGWFDSPAAVEALRFLADLTLTHKVAPSLSQAAATGVDFFADGRAAMKVIGHWALVGLAASKQIDLEEIGVLPVPARRGGPSVTVMYESGLAIGATSREPESAWKYVKFFTSSGVQSRYNASGIAVSARRDVEAAKLAGPGASETARRRTEAFQAIVPTARPPWGSRVQGYDLVEAIGQKAMDAVLKNGVPVDEAAGAAAEEIDRELARR
jgi:multiple sugar transport system substrate-binding protein